MGIRTLGSTLTALCCVGATACTSVNSTDVKTSGLYAHIIATAESGGVRVDVGLDVGTFTSVELHGDQLAAETDGRRTTGFAESSLLGSHGYSAFLPGPADPGQKVTVTLRRSSGSTTSSVTLPGPISVVSPRSQAATRRSQDLLITTTHGAGGVTADWSGSCVTSGSQSFSDDSAVVIGANTIRGVSKAKCLITLTVSRVSTGALDGGFKGGSIQGSRGTKVTVWSAP